MVLSQIQNNLHLISSLASFRLINEYQIDVGGQVHRLHHVMTRPPFHRVMDAT